MHFVVCAKVEIGLLQNLPPATVVTTEPLTADDWEIVVCAISSVTRTFAHATVIGVACGACGEEFVISGARGEPRSRGRHMGPREDEDETESRLVCLLLCSTFLILCLLISRIVSYEPTSQKHNAVLLRTGTEVTIASKNRSIATSTSSKATPLNATSIATKATVGRRLKVRILPSERLVVTSSSPLQEPVAWVSLSSFLSLTTANLPLQSSVGYGPVIMQRLNCPADPIAVDFQPSAPAADIVPPPEHRLKDEDPGTLVRPSESKNVFTLRWSSELPDRHVLLQSAQTPDMKEWKGWESW